MTIYLLLVVFVILAIFHLVTRNCRAGKLANQLPGYPSYPLVGNLLRFNVTDPEKLWELGREMMNRFYPITKIWFVRSALISIRHPDDMQILLTSQKAIDKGYVYNHFHPWLRTGLLTSTGKKWWQRRKILTPGFHFNVLKKYLEIMNEEANKCVSKLEQEGDETVKNVVTFSSDVTLNVICETAMAVSLDNIEEKMAREYKNAINDFGYTVIYRLPRPQIFDWMMKLPWKIGNLHRSSLKVLHDFTNRVVRERRKFHEKNNQADLDRLNDSDDDLNDLGRQKKLAMLDILLAAEKTGVIDDEGIKEEVDTFTFEGFDTTGSGLSFTLMLLADDKQAQDRARCEVREVMSRSDNKLGMAELQELEYLERCVKESLRLFPPVATIMRHTPEDLQLKHGLAPAGSHIMANIYDTHRDPNFWPNPDKFDPDRFLPEQIKSRHLYAYVPFSAGPRNCIGQKFAMMELKTTIAYILNSYYLEPVDPISEVKLMADIVIRPTKPVRIKFIRIQED
ncbi:hypothetical protein QAD02_019618 [Eretmocerus hayati]|uniref:Uncharacterized protein n=1 Tax=Eretmocerus hayati TaxID=131215 RepID=A0ACC2PK37_9HYME|nr:hypothetical protein QAD02_019618 [Eretmocerus hayati]